MTPPSVTLPSPLHSDPTPIPDDEIRSARTSEVREVAEQHEPDPEPKLTICPLDLVAKAEKAGITRDFCEKYRVQPEQIRESVREFVTYWSIGAGIGRKEANWPKKLRKHLQVNCERLGGLSPPGALEHAARPVARTAQAGRGGRPEALSALIPSDNVPYHQVWRPNS